MNEGVEGITKLKKKSASLIKKQFHSSSIKKELKQQAKHTKLSVGLSDLPVNERQLIESIRERTKHFNKNNITRTTAYFDFYRQHPNMHWALLAHMISRNAGWNITDLKGELLPKLLSPKQREDFFNFLERGNWLIFQDAFPQLLLYEESVRRREDMFHLLLHFNVSVFMETMWNYFWNHNDSRLIAFALIINEQNYIENRLIRHPYYQKKVLYSVDFQLQDLLSLNQILFPSLKSKADHIPQLYGQTVHQFASLHERILLGKRLYKLLFQRADMLQQVLNWAVKQPHTGSRKDYFPHLFNTVNESVPGILHKKRTFRCRLRPGALRLYSPLLHQVWGNQKHDPPRQEDWFHDWNSVYHLLDNESSGDSEVKKEYCKTLEKIELAVIAKKMIFQREGV
jgi:hypothetical protein